MRADAQARDLQFRPLACASGWYFHYRSWYPRDPSEMIEKQSVAEINDKYQLDVSTMLDLPVPLECVAGIEANCELLRVHARKVEGFEIPEASDEDSQE